MGGGPIKRLNRVQLFILRDGHEYYVTDRADEMVSSYGDIEGDCIKFCAQNGVAELLSKYMTEDNRVYAFNCDLNPVMVERKVNVKVTTEARTETVSSWELEKECEDCDEYPCVCGDND